MVSRGNTVVWYPLQMSIFSRPPFHWHRTRLYVVLWPSYELRSFLGPQAGKIVMINWWKISHLVASLPTSHQQVVFAMLVPSSQQIWNKLLTTCNKLDGIIRLVTRLFQQVRYSHAIIILLQSCVVNLVTFLLYHDCIRLVRTTL
jgi:hypothetical protein